MKAGMRDMAKKPVKEPEIIPLPELKKKSFVWLWILLTGVSFFLLLAVLHMAGWLKWLERPLYEGTKNTPVIGKITGAFYVEDWEKKLTPQQMVDAKDMRNNIVRLEGEVSDTQRAVRRLNGLSTDISEIKSSIRSVKKDTKGLKEEVAAGGGAAPSEAGMTAGVSAPAIVVPGSASYVPEASTGGGENYRLVSKIFEKLPADTAVDIMNNLTDDEKVKILSQMSEKTVADILTAFDPVKSAELARMIARYRGM
jgi:hypothetical protein